MLPDKSIDMILCDLPYGTTACKWDTVIPFEPLWKQYKRLIKDNGAIVLTASQPFTSALVMSNPTMFKYEWIWEKDRPTGAALAKYRPMKYHENILVFSRGAHIYNPQVTTRHNPVHIPGLNSKPPETTPYSSVGKGGTTTRNPRTIQKINVPNHGEMGLHPTQKPVALFEYLIRTYTNDGDTVVDNCAGSGTTGVACLNTGRKFILIEKDAEYCEMAKRRIFSVQSSKGIIKPLKIKTGNK